MRAEPDSKAQRSLNLERITKFYGGLRAVNDVSLEVHAGEFVTLLGPSGSGKTTTLRIIAGLVRPDGGRVVAHGRDITRIPAYQRDIGIVFQNYALFPHMTAEQNIAFPLKVRSVGRRETDDRVREVLGLVHLSDLGSRFPRQLSGGQQQRVALARAIVFRPWLLLMDEPLGALDKKLREAMQLEITRISRRVGVTVIYVTHDQEEALAMSDRIAIFRQGQVEQIGTGEELYERPASLFVGQFMGESTVLRGTLRGAFDHLTVVSDRWSIRVSAEACKRSSVRSGDRVAVVVRPERLRLGPAHGRSDSGAQVNAVRGTVVQHMYLGSARKYVIDLGGGDQAIVREQVGTSSSPEPLGGSVHATWDLQHGVVVADDHDVQLTKDPADTPIIEPEARRLRFADDSSPRADIAQSAASDPPTREVL